MKFILIDNSIIDSSGHHYQYAMSCLKAAESLGFKPILASNIKNENTKQIPWKTYPIYHYGFWVGEEKSTSKKFYDYFKKISDLKKIKNIEKKIRRHYSIMGYYKEMGGMLPNFLTKPTYYQSVVSISKSLLLLKMIFYGIPFIFVESTNSSTHKITSKASSLFNRFINLTKIEQIDPLSGSVIRKFRIKTFSKDTKNLFDKLHLDEGDHVFIPNVSLTEILGLTDFFQKNQHIEKINLHLLFRRNFYGESRINYHSDSEHLRSITNSLSNLASYTKNIKIFYYTDSDELTTQFDSIKIGKSTTLPIPHTHKSTSHIIHNEKIIISYLGDARTEKGYHFLPRIIQDSHDYINKDKVKFRIQSNFNIKKGELWPRVAKSQLIDLKSNNVELLIDPLSMKEYSELLLNSGIILFPYDSINYFARSSGIFVEALSAGIPVVVPSRTWMSRQFLKQTYEYQISLREKLETKLTIFGNNVSWIFGDSKKIFKNGVLNFYSHDNQIVSRFLVPKSSSLGLISFSFFDNPLNRFVGFIINQFDLHGNIIKKNEYYLEKSTNLEFGTLLFQIENETYYLKIGIKNPETEDLSQIKDFRIDFLSKPTNNNKIPLGVIGGIFNQPNEITESLKEILDNYTHYLKTAKEFSRNYYEFHNALNLVKIITQSNNSKNELKVN